MPRLKVPDYDPEVEALIIEIDDQELHFVFDLAAMKKIGALAAESGGDDDVLNSADSLPKILKIGFERNHPDITEAKIESILSSPSRIGSITAAMNSYIDDVRKGMGDDEEGVAVGEAAAKASPG